MSPDFDRTPSDFDDYERFVPHHLALNGFHELSVDLRHAAGVAGCRFIIPIPSIGARVAGAPGAPCDRQR